MVKTRPMEWKKLPPVVRISTGVRMTAAAGSVGSQDGDDQDSHASAGNPDAT